MTGSVNFSNHQWLVKSYDTNQNGQMDELQVANNVAAKVDTDKNGQISQSELVSALKSDAVEIKNGQIQESQGMNIYTHGLETLKNVHSTAKNSWGHVWAPTVFDSDDLETRANKLQDSNRAYTSAIDRMESSLRSIRDMTKNAGDATSKALHIQAKTALNTTSWRSWANVIDLLVSEHTIGQMERANTNLQASYETLNSTLRAIAEQTKDLPDARQALKATDQSISNAFNNTLSIQNQVKTASEVHTRLNQLADETQAQATGRTLPFAGGGAGIGAVVGGTAGYFLGGKNMKSALIGAGVGAALGGGGGALIGSSIDKGYQQEAKDLRSLADQVKSYNPEAAQSKLMNSTQATYQEALKAREHHDLDNARVSTNNFNNILGQVKPLENESARILSAYKK